MFVLDVRKEPGSVIRHSVSREDLLLINRLAKSELGPDQVYTFAVRLCDNEVDRDWERFDQEALEELSRLFVGRSGIFDHNWSAEGQTARLYKTEVCREEGRTMAGDEARFLKGYAYMLRNEKNQALIEEIEAGIKKEVSIGCSGSPACPSGARSAGRAGASTRAGSAMTGDCASLRSPDLPTPTSGASWPCPPRERPALSRPSARRALASAGK